MHQSNPWESGSPAAAAGESLSKGRNQRGEITAIEEIKESFAEAPPQFVAVEEGFS